MIRAAILAVSFLALISASAAAAAATSDLRFDAFEAACLDGHRDPDARRAAIAKAGWRPVADNADPSLARLMAISREAMIDAEAEDGFTGAIAAYGQGLDGGVFYLVTTELDMPADAELKIDLLGCYLYDFAATAPLDAGVVSRRFGERPAEVVDEPGVIVAQTWNVDAIEGVWELRNTFIPPDSPAASITGFTGVVISVTTTRG